MGHILCGFRITFFLTLCFYPTHINYRGYIVFYCVNIPNLISCDWTFKLLIIFYYNQWFNEHSYNYILYILAWLFPEAKSVDMERLSRWTYTLVEFCWRLIYCPLEKIVWFTSWSSAYDRIGIPCTVLNS